MSDKELIRQEIERRFNDNMKASEQYKENSKSRALFTSASKEDYDLLAFIDSLPEEPASEDLEEDSSFEKLLQEIYIKYNKQISIEKLLDIASHFAHWQHGKDFDNLLQSQMEFPKEFYEKGKTDAVKEMMEDAIECDVIKNGNKSDCLVWKDDTAFKRIISKLNNGDKVKIIVKEEQQ